MPKRSRRRKRLYFSTEYLETILSGKKRSTIRIWTPLKPGDVVDVVVGGRVVAKARILDVVEVKASKLSDVDARLDGFKDRKDLMRALKRHYPWFRGRGEEVCIIYFKLINGDRKRRARGGV